MRTLDLFCGAGGSSYGAHQAGAEIVAALDYWQTAVDTYNANFGEGKARCIWLPAYKPVTDDDSG
jgi:DNA (cytosine-5)-methyltransferase 1